MRTFEIWVDWCAWSLNEKGKWCEDKKQGKLDKKRLEVYPFPTFVLTDDDKLLGFFNLFLNNKTLDKAKDDPLFAEVCHFEAHTQRNETDIRDKNFEGTIYEALVWIKKEFYQVIDEGWGH